jgi:hypothetical protein
MTRARIITKSDGDKLWFILVTKNDETPAKSLDFIKLKMWADARNYDLVDEKPRKKLRWKVTRGNLAMPLKKNAGPSVPLEEFNQRNSSSKV